MQTSAALLSVEVEYHPNATIVVVAGEFDALGREKFRRMADEVMDDLVVDGGAQIVFDFSRLRSVDAGGLDELSGVVRAASKRKIQVRLVLPKRRSRALAAITALEDSLSNA